MVKHTTTTTTTTERPVETQNTSSCKYKGVRKRKWGKWVSEIRLPNSRERIWLGSYNSAEKAARAFDAALYCLRGRTAKFNFPDNPPEIAGGTSLTPSEIQAAAARFANTEPLCNTSRADQEDEYNYQSPSRSVSEGTAVSAVNVESETGSRMETGSFLDVDVLRKMGSGNFVSDFELFPGFDDLRMGDEFFASTLPAEEDQFAGNQDIFLWNF